MDLSVYFKEEIKDTAQKEKILSEACYQKISIKTLEGKECSFSQKKDIKVSFLGIKGNLEGVFSLNNQLLLITSRLDQDSSSITMPDIFRLNRRENFRFQVPKIVNSEVSFSGKRSVINDISSEGLSFLIKDEKFNLGQTLNLEFILKDSDFKVVAEIKGIIPQKDGVQKIGVKFIKFTEGRQWDLTNIISRLAIQFKK